MRSAVFKFMSSNTDGGLIRSASECTVLRARNASRISIAAPSDFVCSKSSPAALVPGAFPYCLDFLRARAVYVTGVDPQGVQGAPFYYLHLRQHARRVLNVPIDHAFVSTTAAEQPVFLFSPGRCGSTLLSRVLFETGIPSVSEPDFYTQMASWFWSRPFNPLAARYRRAMWTMSEDLSAALGAVPVVKLRAQCTRAPELFVPNPATRTIALFRRFESWARSTAQVFGNGPAKAVRKYMSALQCYAWLTTHSRCLLVRYEDWLSDPGPAAGKLGDFLGHNLCPQAADRALQTHSQQNTPLIHRILPGWQAKWEGAMALWQSPRLVTARRRLEIPDVWD